MPKVPVKLWEFSWFFEPQASVSDFSVVFPVIWLVGSAELKELVEESITDCSQSPRSHWNDSDQISVVPSRLSMIRVWQCKHWSDCCEWRAGKLNFVAPWIKNDSAFTEDWGGSSEDLQEWPISCLTKAVCSCLTRLLSVWMIFRGIAMALPLLKWEECKGLSLYFSSELEWRKSLVDTLGGAWAALSTVRYGAESKEYALQRWEYKMADSLGCQGRLKIAIAAFKSLSKLLAPWDKFSGSVSLSNWIEHEEIFLFKRLPELSQRILVVQHELQGSRSTGT